MCIAKFEGMSAYKGAQLGISFINTTYFSTYLHNTPYVRINKGALSLAECNNKSTIPPQGNFCL